MPLAKSRENNVQSVRVLDALGDFTQASIAVVQRKEKKKFVITKYTSINDVHYMIKAFSIYDAESDVIGLSCYISSNYEPSKSSD